MQTANTNTVKVRRPGWEWGSRPWLVFLIMGLPWLVASSPLWQFSRDTFIVPLAPDLFDLSFKLLADQRLVLSTWLMHPLLVTYSFLGPALLVLLFYLFRRIFRELSWSLYLSMTATLLLYELGAPGTAPVELLGLVFTLFCINPLLIPTKPLILWIFSGLVFLLSFATQQNDFLLFWITLSMSLGYLIHFLLAQKSHLPKQQRDKFVVTGLTALGLTCLAISILFLSLQNSIHRDLIHTTPDRWWLAWILGALCVALTWLRPWETHRWLSLAIFGHGIFLSPAIEFSVWLVIGWVLMHIVAELPILSTLSKQARAVKIKPAIFHSVLLVLVLLAIIFQIHRFHPIREFRAGWVSLAHEIQPLNTRGFMVIGEGSSFLAHFSKFKLIEDPSLLEIDSEAALSKRLEDEGVDSILVDARYVNRFWRRWIKDQKDAETSNTSIITRLLSDGGKEIKLRTIKLEALSDFKITPFQRAVDFYLIEKTARKSERSNN